MTQVKDLLDQARKTIIVGKADYDIPPEMLERWRADPAGVSEEEFAHYSDGGYVYVGGDATPCPVSAYRAKIDRLMAAMRKQGIPERYLTVGWDDLEQVTPFPRLRRDADRIEYLIGENASLLLTGPPGHGKTQCAMLLARAAIDCGKSVYVVNLADLSIEIRAGYDNKDGALSEKEAIDKLVSPDLLVLEDMGAGESGSAAIEKRLMYHLTEKRQNARRPVIITTNLTPPEIKDTLGQRIFDRLMPLTPIVFSHGRNFRAPAPDKELW